jgi:hypothetical protein
MRLDGHRNPAGPQHRWRKPITAAGTTRNHKLEVAANTVAGQALAATAEGGWFDAPGKAGWHRQRPVHRSTSN